MTNFITLTSLSGLSIGVGLALQATTGGSYGLLIALAGIAVAGAHHLDTTRREGIEGIEGVEGLEGIEGISAEGRRFAREGIEGVEGVEGLEGIEGISAEGRRFAREGIEGAEGVEGIEGIGWEGRRYAVEG